MRKLYSGDGPALEEARTAMEGSEFGLLTHTYRGMMETDSN